jgi:flagellar biogenesis protein FliO
VWPARSRSTAREIDIVESTRLGDRMHLSVIRFHDRELLIAHGEHSATVIADAPIPTFPRMPLP